MNLMKTNCLIIIVVIFFSCVHSVQLRTHGKLIGCESVLVMEDGDQATAYYTDHENFIKPYLSESQLGDTLVLTTLKEINACGRTEGDIRFSGDTIFLETKLSSQETCASVVFHKFTYKVNNPTKQKYFIRSCK